MQEVSFSFSSFSLLSTSVLKIVLSEDQLLELVGVVNRALRGVVEERSRREFCSNGHEWNEANTAIRKTKTGSSYVSCRVCTKISRQKYDLSKKVG